MAVLPDHQRSGIGSRLVEEGLQACRAADHRLVVVIGHDTYYPRFGFVEAATLGLRCEYDVPSEAFMALELGPGSVTGRSGTIRFRPEFDV
jgi:putative acetyltransferase